MPPVALTAATASAPTAPIAPPATTPVVAPAVAPAVEEHEDGQPTTFPTGRRALRLVASAQPGEIVHGRGGPSSCNCRECTMARHPASMPRLRVVQ